MLGECDSTITNKSPATADRSDMSNVTWNSGRNIQDVKSLALMLLYHMFQVGSYFTISMPIPLRFTRDVVLLVSFLSEG